MARRLRSCQPAINAARLDDVAAAGQRLAGDRPSAVRTGRRAWRPSRASASALRRAASRSSPAARAGRAGPRARSRSPATSSTGRRVVAGDLDDVERRVQRVERDHARRERLGHCLAPVLGDRGLHAARDRPRRSSFGNRAASASTRGCEMRDRRRHVVRSAGASAGTTSFRGRSDRPASISIAACTASSTRLSSASIAFHSETKPKISRLSRNARTISCGLAPVVSISRCTNVLPTRLSMLLVTWVAMISRFSGCWPCTPA